MNLDTVYTFINGLNTWIKIAGRGTFQNSQQIKKYLLEKIEGGCSHFYIDLSECISMDSTFMGIITGLSIRMRGINRDPVSILNISAHNMRLLETLGLNKFLDIKEKFTIDASIKWEILPIETADKISITKHMLDAHQQLVQTGGLAVEQFKNVHKLLKEDLERQIKRNGGKNNK